MTTPSPEATVNASIRQAWDSFRGYNAASNPLDNAHALIALTQHMRDLASKHPLWNNDAETILLDQQ